MAARFQPREHIRNEMRRRCKVAGVVFADVRWEPERECLCTYELWSGNDWHIERELRDDDGDPRQVHEGDIKEIESRMRGKRSDIDNWFGKFKASRDSFEFARKMNLRNLCHDTSREINKRSISRLFSNNGSSVRADAQYPCDHGPMRATCEVCREESRKTFYMRG